MTQVWQISFRAPYEKENELSQLFEDWAIGTSWFENEEDNTWEFIAYFDHEPLREQIQKQLNKLISNADFTITLLPKIDWAAKSYEEFSPFSVGRFYIYGSHINKPNLKADKIPLQIGAATAFGSGHHETTEGCLLALENLSKSYQFQKPLDMGCGSGILAFALASLWQAPVFACDNDPEAVKVTTKNAEINHLSHLIEAQLSEGFSSRVLKSKAPFDIITANILARPLCMMAQSMCTHLTENGIIVLSGLLNSQTEQVDVAYRLQGCKMVDKFSLGDWSTLIMRKI